MKYKVGDKVWLAKCRWEPVREPCNVCFGRLQVKLILGNDDEVTLPCNGCAPGYEDPRGWIEEYHYVIDPDLVIITGMEISVSGEKEVVRYRGGPYSYDEQDLFVVKGDAVFAGIKKKKALEEEQRTRADHIKNDNIKSFSWNAHYHMKQVKYHEKQIEYHKEKALLCKAREKSCHSNRE